MPSTKLFGTMGRFAEDLIEAGSMQVAHGLKPSSEGKRVAFDGPGRTVRIGYWLVS